MTHSPSSKRVRHTNSYAFTHEDTLNIMLKSTQQLYRFALRSGLTRRAAPAPLQLQSSRNCTWLARSRSSPPSSSPRSVATVALHSRSALWNTTQVRGMCAAAGEATDLKVHTLEHRPTANPRTCWNEHGAHLAKHCTHEHAHSTRNTHTHCAA